MRTSRCETGEKSSLLWEDGVEVGILQAREMVKSLNEFQPGLTNHSRRVLRDAYLFSIVLGLADEFIASKSDFAALLHDCGKMGVNNRVLNARRKLRRNEKEEMEMHSAYSQWVVANDFGEEFLEAALIISQIHEHFDGSGYPKGLAGEEISLMARLIAIVDSYDALTSHRIYRKKMGERAAIALMDGLVFTKTGGGAIYDPELWDRFLQFNNDPQGKKRLLKCWGEGAFCLTRPYKLWLPISGILAADRGVEVEGVNNKETKVRISR